jgi:hypothetical protein
MQKIQKNTGANIYVGRSKDIFLGAEQVHECFNTRRHFLSAHFILEIKQD